MLDLGWVPRDQNQKADAITNNNSGDFRFENQVKVNLDRMEFNVLRVLLQLGVDFYAARESELEAERKATAAATAVATRAARGVTKASRKGEAVAGRAAGAQVGTQRTRMGKRFRLEEW